MYVNSHVGQEKCQLEDEAPEPAGAYLGDNSSLAMHLEPPKVDYVENSVDRIEADIDRSREPFEYYLMQIPTVWIDPYQRAPDWWSSGGHHRRLVAEERGEDLSGPLMCGCRCHANFATAEWCGKRSNGRRGDGNSSWLASTNVGAGPRCGRYFAAVMGSSPMKSSHPYHPPWWTSKSMSGALPTGRLPRSSAP